MLVADRRSDSAVTFTLTLFSTFELRKPQVYVDITMRAAKDTCIGMDGFEFGWDGILIPKGLTVY